MADDNSPVENPATATEPASVPRHEVEEVAAAKRKWTLELHRGHLSLLPDGEAQPFIFLREDIFKKIEWLAGMRILSLQIKPKVGLKLTREAAEAFGAWLGVPNRDQLAVLLKRRFGLAMPIAIILVLTAVPFPGSDMTWHPITLALGLPLIVMALWVRFKPHPIFFLLDAIWFLVIAISHGATVYRNRHWPWFILTALLLWIALNGFKRYRQFRGRASSR